MSAVIIPFPGCEFPDQTANEQPQPDLIELLEHWLELAESGELQAVACAGVLSNTTILTVFTPGTGPNRHTLIAGTADLQHRMLREVVDGDEGGDEDPPPPMSASIGK